jgi:predicted transcriptional regulator
MSKVMAILVMCDSDDLNGIVSDFFKQFQNGKAIPEIKADYVKPLVVSETLMNYQKQAVVKDNKTREAIINFIKSKDGWITYSDLDKANICNPKTISYWLKQMVAEGILNKEGDSRPYRYELANPEEGKLRRLLQAKLN